MPIVQTGTKQSVAMTSTQTNTQKPTATACTRELIQVANDQVTNAEPLLNFKGSETLPQLSTESQRNYRIFPENNESILEHPDASESKVDDGNFEISDDCGAEKDELIRPYYKSKVTSLPISISPSILEETKETMVKEVNPDGIAVWWLRPIAWIGARLGYHGIGQSNCSSCSVAVADSLKIGQLCRADPTLRGGRRDQFETLANIEFKMFNPIDKLDPSNESKLDPIDKLVEYIQANQDLNAVLLIKRPWYYRFFSGVDGHAVNIFQYAGTTHYMDAQKKIYPSISAEAKKMKSELTSLIGSFHGSLEIGNVGF